MGVYIKGMEMPETCQECEFAIPGVDFAYCERHENTAMDFSAAENGRPDWCPLVEVPPHGRLVDESWLKKAMITTLEALKKNPKMDRQEMHLIAAFDTLGKMVDDAPTIIESEEET